MLKIVADTNILVSAFISKGNEYEILKLAKFGDIKIISSFELFEEFREVIKREKFGFSDEQTENFIKQVSDIVEIIPCLIKLEVVKEDIDDNRVLEVAVGGGADYIVSGDEHLLKLMEFNNIKITNSKEFLDIVRKDND